ncbi:hypothetical protein RRG08_021422 [Elysia crispata]|uniref:Uncharacterized protein n=1 Tax=Elysia crispata TaxID=231223 RepID=A0AAE1A6X8_9GAST|nr:hypothetical protein RRG08_021422 [Elysia crispata]
MSRIKISDQHCSTVWKQSAPSTLGDKMPEISRNVPTTHWGSDELPWPNFVGLVPSDLSELSEAFSP